MEGLSVPAPSAQGTYLKETELLRSAGLAAVSEDSSVVLQASHGMIENPKHRLGL